MLGVATSSEKKTKYRCSFENCNLATEDCNQLKLHMKLNHNCCFQKSEFGSGTDQHTGGICSCCAHRERKVTTPRKNSPLNSNQNYRCHICGWWTNNSFGRLQEHYLRMHNSRIFKYICLLNCCGFLCDQVEDLIVHHKCQHKATVLPLNSDQKYQCHLCAWWTNNSFGSLKQHYSNRHGANIPSPPLAQKTRSLQSKSQSIHFKETEPLLVNSMSDFHTMAMRTSIYHTVKKALEYLEA